MVGNNNSWYEFAPRRIASGIHLERNSQEKVKAITPRAQMVLSNIIGSHCRVEQKVLESSVVY